LFPPSRAPPQLQSSKFYLWLKDIIIDRLNNLLLVQHECILAQQSKQKSRGPSQDQFSKSEVKQVDHGSVSDGSTTQEKGSKSEGNMMTQMDGSHRKLLLGQHQRGTSSSCYILNLLVAISEVAPSFVENFTPLLLKLTQSFMKEHLIYTTRQNRFSPSNTSSQQSNVSGGEQSINDIADIVMATPSIAILTEWTNIQSGHSGLSRNNFTVRTEENQMAGGSKDALGSGVKDSSVKKTREQLLRSTGPKFKGKLNLMGCVGRKSTVEMLIFCLKLISFCPLNVPEHRRMYFNLLMHCIESSRDVALLLEVIGIVDGMISGNMNEAFSLRERLSLVAKMASFERMHEATALSVFRAYHRLLLKLSKTEELELASLSPSSGGFPSQFMMGLMAPESAIREGFLNRFLVDTDAHPTSRLKHVLKQDWQICGSRFWVVILVDVLLASVCDTSYVKQNEFTEEIKAADIFEPLRVLVQIDVHIASDLWVSLFNHVWSISTDASRKGIAQNLSVILSSKFHTRHLQVPFDMWHGRLNVVQSLLKAVTLVQPLPVMTPELILHLAPTYSVWTDAIRLCEFQVQNDQIDAELRVRWIESLSSLYRQLDEDDLFVGLHVNHSSRVESRVALLLEALGCVHEAQEEYLKGLTRTNSSLNDFEAMSVSELRVWEERWVECAKQLCQWQLMNDFAKATQSPELLLECAWKRGDWSSAKQLLLSPSTQTSLETWCPESRLQRLYIAILDGEKKSTVENLSAQTVELALTQWQGLPRVLSRAHVRLMHLFHKFIEVKESIQMMSDIKCASQQHSLPNLKPSINTWRERLPNKWEPILLWDDILTWRSHMFQVVKSTFAWSDPQVLACMHDTPWSIIKLAHTARKQHLPDVCLGALSKLYSVPAMDVQDAFSKLREQVSICYESSTEYSGGLSILNNTNLDYFSLRQKSEMFRLKALFLQSMGRLSDANQTFSQCLQICDSYGKGWLSWGNYCYELFLSRREMSIASQAIACYLQAIQHRCNSGRMMIARVLWLLSMDDDQGTLIQSFEAHGKQLPIWIWIIWIPQLLMALNRPEAPQVCVLFLCNFYLDNANR
jgi:transformation/transcription domain-associated protein